MRNIEDVRENFKRGVIDLAILLLLEKEDMYPYQIGQEVQKRTQGKLQFFVGSMYGPLRRMMQHGEISEHTELAGVRRFRNYYHLEEKGRVYLKQLKEEYQTLSEGVQILLA